VVPEPVWDLLDHVLGRAPNVAAVVYEVLQDSFSDMGFETYRGQIQRLRDHWQAARAGLVEVTS
jgi:hypothetical protein